MLALHRSLRVLPVAAMLLALGCDGASMPEMGPLVPSSESGIAVLATLDDPLPERTSVWCATFPLSWAELARAIRADETLELDTSHPAVERIDRSPVRADDLVPGSFFVAAGRGSDGIAEQIRVGVAETFGGAQAPDLAVAPSSFLAYAELRAAVRFGRTFRPLDGAIQFQGTDGTSAVDGFGLDEGDDGAYARLREQVGVLFRKTDEAGRPTSWAIELDTTNEEVEVVVAHIPRKPTMSDAIAALEAGRPASRSIREFGPRDVLRVPNVALHVTHRFAEFEGVEIADRQTIEVARQDVAFRLDRTGARLTSRSRWSVFSGATDYTFDRPFLLTMSRRGAERPFFAMWIEDAAALEALPDGR